MCEREILKKTDHSLLLIKGGEKALYACIEVAKKYEVASICIPPVFVKKARDYAGAGLVIGTVVGFPNGYSTSHIKVLEATEAVRNGATEIDMVLNKWWLEDGLYQEIIREIQAVKAVSPVLKVIIETSVLSTEEKIKAAELVRAGGADYIKTSTGFHGSGAVVADIVLFKDILGSDVKIKASGGIHNFRDARQMLEAGADRIGASKLVGLYADSQ